MASLSAANLRDALALTNDLLLVNDDSDLREEVLARLARLAGADCAVYHHITYPTMSEVTVDWPAGSLQPAVFIDYRHLIAEHPLIQHSARYPEDGQGRRISDVRTRKAWHDNPVYAEIFRPLGIEDEAAVMIGRTPQEVVAISVARSGGNFPDSACELLTALRLHLTAASRRILVAEPQIPGLRVSPMVGKTALPRPPSAWYSVQLTPRESEVVAWLSAGLSSRSIAVQLHIAERTVNKHLERIYAKLGVSNRVAALRKLDGDKWTHRHAVA